MSGPSWCRRSSRGGTTSTKRSELSHDASERSHLRDRRSFMAVSDDRRSSSRSEPKLRSGTAQAASLGVRARTATQSDRVEVGRLDGAIRDSKDPEGEVLSLVRCLGAFVADVRGGRAGGAG
ncbi:DUF397 domain-containing protein [Spirillospora sp. NPDC046719]